jgi:hypothetical protein
VIVVVAVLLRALLGSGGHASNGTLSANTRTTSKGAAASPSPTASPSHGLVTPTVFDGAWSGIVTQPPTDTYRVSVTFTAGKAAGTISYTSTDFSCSGALTLTKTTTRPSMLTLSQGIIQGQSKCENGTVTITLSATNKIWFSFHSNGPIASGTLVRG